MKGMDVSQWQSGSYPGAFNSVAYSAIPKVDFVIVKASEGTSFKDPLFEKHYDYCKGQGKLMGAYHYANGGDPVSEARHFHSVIKSRLGQLVPCLDWECGRNQSWGSRTWCLRFCNEFYRLSGLVPMIYVQASALDQVAACSKTSKLWIAGYPDRRASFDPPAFIYSTSPWRNYTVWQFSSGGSLDRDTSNATRAQWLAMCGAEWDVAASEGQMKDIIRKAICGV